MYIGYGERGHAHPDPNIRRSWAYIRRILQMYWLPTFTELRSTLHAEEAQTTQTEVRSPVALIRRMVEKWKQLGTVYKLSDTS